MGCPENHLGVSCQAPLPAMGNVVGECSFPSPKKLEIVEQHAELQQLKV